MPEGDSVWRAANRLHQALSTSPLTHSDFRVPALATVDLVGRHTTQVLPYGKHLLHRLEGGVTVHSHLKMEGSWRVFRQTSLPKAAYRHTVRAVLGTTGSTAVGDSLGMLDVLETRNEARVVGHLGPDLLSPEFDSKEAINRLMRLPDRGIGEALLDQRNVAGMGTIFVSEPLFAHQINPTSSVGEVAPILTDVLETAQRMLVISVRTSREPMQIYGRRGLPCLRCGNTARWAPVGVAPAQRMLSYCPVCQGGLASTDSGAPVTPLGHRGS